MLRALSLLFVVGALGAQTTWIVDQANGPGTNFTTLPAAVAAASNGDTLLVRPAPFLGAYSAFTTNKGITIVGQGFVQIATSDINRVVIENVPQGETFQMSNFHAQRTGHIAIDITNCQGRVHLEELFTYEWGLFGPSTNGISIVGSALVSLRNLEIYGIPSAVQATASRVEINNCQLGIGAINLGLGQPLDAVGCDLFVTQPRFTSHSFTPAIGVNQCNLTIIGDVNSFLQASDAFPRPVREAIYADNSTVTLDPDVRLNPNNPGPSFAGNSAPALAELSGIWVDPVVAGRSVLFRIAAPAGSLVAAAVGRPALPVALPQGDLLLDTAGLTTVFFLRTPVSQLNTWSPVIPTAIPSGTEFGIQAAVVLNGTATLSGACLFTVN